MAPEMFSVSALSPSVSPPRVIFTRYRPTVFIAPRVSEMAASVWWLSGPNKCLPSSGSVLSVLFLNVSPGNLGSCSTSSPSEKRLLLDKADTRLGNLYKEAPCTSRLSTGTVGLCLLFGTTGLSLDTDWSTNLGTLKFSVAMKDTSRLDCCVKIGSAEVSGGLQDDAACPSRAGAESGVLQGTPCRLDGNSCVQKLSRAGRSNGDVPGLYRASPNVPAQPTATKSVSVSPSNKMWHHVGWRGS